jgi:hypothetical protein
LHTAGSTADLTQALVPTVGDTYKVTFTVTSGSAGYRARLYFGGSWSDIDDFDGTYTVYITATSADPLLFRPSDAAFNGTVDNVSVKKITTASNSKIESPVDFVKRITVWDKIDFPDGHAIAIGHDAFRNNGTGQYNVPSSNIAIGYEAGKNTTIGQVTAVGYEAAKAFAGEGSVTAFGKWAGYTLGAESYVTLVGNAAGLRTQSGRTSAFGDETASLNTTGEKSAFGGYAAYNNTTGDIDAFGLDSQRDGGSVCTGNASFGRESFYKITSDNNSGFGYKIGRNTTSGTVTGVGAFAGYANTTGSLVLIGNHAGYGAVTSNAPVTDTGGILIGNFANRSVASATVLTNYVGIGDGVLIDRSNQVKIGNSSIVETILNGNVLIGSETDLGGYKLQVTGNAIVTGNMALPGIRLNGDNLDGYVGVNSSSILYLTDWLTAAKGMTIDLATGAVTTSHTNTAAIGFGVGATADANFPFRALSSLNATYGFLVNNTSTGSSASSALLLESDAGQAALRQYSSAHSVWPGNTVISSPSGGNGIVLVTSGASNPIEFHTNNTLRASISDTGATFNGSVRGRFDHEPITKSALLATTPVATLGVHRLTDSTPSQRRVYPDGTNWRYYSDDSIVS